MVWVNENMLLSWIIARRYWSDELVVWRPIGWQELLLITKELLDLYISRNRVASEPCAMKSFRIYLPISAFIASFKEGKHATVTNHSYLGVMLTIPVYAHIRSQFSIYECPPFLYITTRINSFAVGACQIVGSRIHRLWRTRMR